MVPPSEGCTEDCLCFSGRKTLLRTERRSCSVQDRIIWFELGRSSHIHGVVSPIETLARSY